MKVLSIVQRKGGVAKSTSTLNLAYALAETGSRILVVDLDDQQNTTSSITGSGQTGLSVTDLLLQDDIGLPRVMQDTAWPNVRILPASAGLSSAAKHLDSEVGGHLVLHEKLQAACGLDYVLIDTSPSLNILVLNALCAADYLFIPLSSRYFSLQGLSQTLEAFHKVKQRLNPGLSLLGMAFVIHDSRSTLAGEIVARVQAQYPSLLFETMIGINIKIEEAQVRQQSVLSYAPTDRGAEQYRALAGEILLRAARRKPGEVYV